MPNPDNLLLIGAILNVLSFILFGVDKLLAKQDRRRISEKALLLTTAVFATPGAAFGMILFNHKTSKPKFRYGIPILAILHAGFFYWLSM